MRHTEFLIPDLSIFVIITYKLIDDFRFSLKAMCDRLNIRRHEMKAYFRGQLSPSRFEEINKEIHKLGVVI